MKHFAHPHCNAVLKPAEGDEDVVDALHVQRGQTEEAVTAVRSFWKPSPEQLAALNADGCVALTCLTTQHPPVRLDVLNTAGDAV